MKDMGEFINKNYVTFNRAVDSSELRVLNEACFFLRRSSGVDIFIAERK